jgi:2-deoxy-D-gluconate 3-dehydrogenase
LQARGLAAVGCAVDVGEKASVLQMVDRALEQWEGIDILVNSAALDPKFEGPQQDEFASTFEDLPADVWDRSLRVNLTGVFLCSQAVTRPMLRRGAGVIINIGSTYGLVGPDQRIYGRRDGRRQVKPVHYSVSKAGVLGLTRYLAAYFAGTRIRVNTLTPGGIRRDQDAEFVEAYSSRTPMGRMADRHEMNSALLFLASDASAYMTGGNLVVDGGWTAW